jgi:hypothetical protein
VKKKRNEREKNNAVGVKQQIKERGPAYNELVDFSRPYD